MTQEEIGQVAVKVSGVLEKFDGDGEDRILREKIFIEENEVVMTEFYDEEGNHIQTVEGGTNGTN